MLASHTGVKSSRGEAKSKVKTRPITMQAGEVGSFGNFWVDGALREAREKIAFLKQQLADLSDAVSYASDGSRDMPPDPLGDLETRHGDKNINEKRGYPNNGSFDSGASRSSRGSRAGHVDALMGNPLFNNIANHDESRNSSHLQLELDSGEAKVDTVEDDTEEKRIDAVQNQTPAPGIDMNAGVMVSPFAKFATMGFQQDSRFDEAAEVQQSNEDNKWDEVKGGDAAEESSEDAVENGVEEDEDADVFHSPRSYNEPSAASSSTGGGSSSHEDTSFPHTPHQPEITTEQDDGPSDTDDPQLAINDGIPRPFPPSGRNSSSGKPQISLKSQPSMETAASGPGMYSNVSGAPVDADVEFERDAVAWILYSLGSYITWPSKNKRKSPKETQLPPAYGLSQPIPQQYSGPKVSSSARGIREQTSKLWEGRGVDMVEELWELIAGIIESQDQAKDLSAKSCWFSGRSLHSAADGLPFAFTVHTFSAPGVPCTVGRANVSAEVCCADVRKAPQCILPPDKGDEEGGTSGSTSVHPDPPEESSPIKRSLSGQLVNGHFIATHSSLEQHPLRVVDVSLGCDPSGNRIKGPPRQPSPEVPEASEFSLGSGLQKAYSTGSQLQHRRHRKNREDTFSFNSESSGTSNNTGRCSPLQNDHMGTADLTAFIRSPEETRAPAENSTGCPPSDYSSPTDEFDAGTADLVRDGAASPSGESESLSFHNRAAAADMSNEQFDTADLSGFVSPRDKDHSKAVSDSEKSGESVADPPQSRGVSPSFGDVDLVWEVRYVEEAGKDAPVIEMTLAPTESEDEEGSVRTWSTYPGNSDSEDSVQAAPSLFSFEEGTATQDEKDENQGKKGRISHRVTQSADMEILRSVSLKGFLANQAEQRKNSRRRMENVETVAEIESVGSASSRRQGSSPSARHGRPPLGRPPHGMHSSGDRRTDKKPPVSSGSRKEMLSKDKRKEKAQKKARLPNLSKLVRRVYTFIGGRSSKPDEVEIDGVRAVKSERVLPFPDRVLRPTQSGPDPHLEQMVKLSSPLEDKDPEPATPAESPMSRQFSVESIPVPDTARGMEMVVHNRSGDPNVVQDAFWGYPASVSLPVKDLGNGRYLVMGHLAGEGRYEISVKVGGKHVLDSPMEFTVVPPGMLGSGITPDGPFYPHPDLPIFPAETTALAPHPNYPPCHSVSYDAQRVEYACCHPHVGCVDLLFAVDATASMTAEIAELPSVVQELSALIGEVHLCKRVRFGVIGYRDHWPEDDHAFVLSKLDFTEDIQKVCSFILSLKASGGGDYPEALEAALLDAAEGVSWWPFSTRLVIWVGDAPPHGYEGMGPKQAMEHEEAFLRAKERVKQAAAAVDDTVGSEKSSQWTEHDAELSAALRECDKLAMYHDNFPLGVPGGVRWEEASVRLEAVGARVIAVGLRDAIHHAPSQACLRSIAHLTGGALLEVGNLHGSVVGPLTTAIVEQQLDQQLVEEEVCDLIICMREDFKMWTPQECQKAISEVMNKAKKLPHRLQVLLADAEKQDANLEDGLDRADSVMHRDGSGSSDAANPSSRHLALTAEGNAESQSLLLGMQTVELHDNILEQVLKGIRCKAEAVGLALQAGFGTRSSWLETLGSGLSDISGVHGRRAHKRIAEEVLTSPVALRYLLAEKNITQMLAGGTWPRPANNL